MKKVFFTTLTLLQFSVCSFGQMTIGSPMVVNNYINSPATTIYSGGSILVGSGGTWAFNGNVTSADLGGANTPNITGRSETMTFDGNGGFTSNGFVINGYAATTAAQTASLILPIGNAITAYPVTVPIGTAITIAYFDGSGISQSTLVTSHSSPTTEYSPYLDIPSGITAGSYTFSYPSGFSSGNSSLLSSGNSSASGTTSSTAYSLLSNVSTFSTSAANTTATLPSTTATQLYYATSNTILPVTLASFTGTANGCSANLAWQTSSESNSSYYAVEVRTDANSFDQIGKVQSKNSAAGAKYTFTYALGAGATYFRIKAVDNDNKYAYSPVVVVLGNGACGTGVKITVWPNPTSDLLNIKGLVAGNYITLLDGGGQHLMTKVATGSTDHLNIGMYASGLYTLRIQATDGTISNVKVVKQ